MNCTLTNEQQKLLLKKVYKDLQRLAKAEGPFSLEDYIKDFYNHVFNKTQDPALALTYGQLIPEFVSLSFTGRNELKQKLRSKGLSSDALDDMIALFNNIENVKTIISPPISKATVEDTVDSIADEQSKVPEPAEVTPEEVIEDSKELVEYNYRTNTLFSVSGQEGMKREDGKWTNIPDPEQKFYYDFYDKFADALAEQGGSASDITISNHKGFRLKLIRKHDSHFPKEKARLDEQRLLRGEVKDKDGKLIPKERGEALYYGGKGAVVTDLEGNIIFFDPEHNIVPSNDPNGKPIYFSIRNVYEEKGELQVKGYDIQSAEEIASMMFSPTETIKSFNDLAKADPGLHNLLIEKAKRIRNTQLQILHAVGKYLSPKGGKPTDTIMVDITGVSRGVLDIRMEAATRIDSIDWENSDVKFNVAIADLTNPNIGEVAGSAYIRVPNHRSIPIQKNNFSSREINAITSLLLDNVTWESFGEQVAVPNSVKKKLVENYTLTSSTGLQVIVKKDGSLKLLLKGSLLSTTTPEDIVASKKALSDFFNTKHVNEKTGKETIYNIKEGRFAFSKPKAGNIIEEFDVVDGMLNIKKVSFEEHVKNNSTLEVVPNEENRLVFLNGYFTYSLPNEEKRKLGLDIVAKSTITTEDKTQPSSIRANVDFEAEASGNQPTKKQKLKQWIKDYYLKTKESTKTLGAQIATTSKIIAKHKNDWDSYSEKEQAQIAETFTNIAKVVPQIAAFIAPVPGTATVLQIIKNQNKYINNILSYSNEALQEYNERLKTEVSDIDSNRETVSPEQKVEEFKEKTKKGKGPLSKGLDLYMAPFLSMKATPAEIKAAKTWFENSPLSKHIGYQEMFDIVNSNAWAEFVNGGIKLYAGANHTALYHEAWHAFSQHFLSKEQKRDLYGEIITTSQGQKAIDKWAKDKGVHRRNLTPYEEALAVEELIAEDFRQYMLSGGKKVLGGRPKRNTVFRRIFNFLKELFATITVGGMWNTTRTYKLTELYEKLRVGNINEYTPSQKNAFFTESALYKVPDPVEGEVIQISDQDALLVVESIDSIISDIIDAENDANGNTMFTSTLFTMPNKIIPETNQTFLESVYDAVYDVLSSRKGEFEAQAEEASETEKKRLLDKAGLIQNILVNWGHPSQKEGMIAFHMEKSPFLSSQLKDIDKETFAVTKADIDATRFDKTGSELSMMDLASNQVLYLVKGLREYNKEGQLIENSLGFNKLADYGKTWRKLVNTLSEKNSSPKVMQEALQKGAVNSPWMQDLLNKLGDVNSRDASTFDLWTQFWSAFYMANWPLYQVSVNEVNDQDTGEQHFEVLTGYASAVFRQVERDFKSYFKSVKNHEFITDSGRIGNILNYAVLDKYKSKLQTPADKISFLNDIGFPIANTKSIREGIEDIRIDHIFSKLQKLKARKVQITDIIKALREEHSVEIQTNLGTTISTIPSETSNLNKLLALEARYSGIYANTAVSNATGNTQFEQTQMSTLGVLQSSINEVNSFQELIDLPHMSHMKYENNPQITASIWMKSIFEFNETTQKYGKKIAGVKFLVDNLSGTQNQIDQSYADFDYSTETAKSDDYTRLLQDMYSGLMGGRFSTMVHADKSTTLSVRVSEVNTGTRSESKHLYIDIADFLAQGSKTNLAVENAFNLLLPYLDGELTRINKIKANDSSIPAIPGYTVANEKGIITGDKLTVFDDIFKEETKNKILEAGSTSALSAELQLVMLNELKDYFNFSYKQTLKTLDRMHFVDSGMHSYLEKEAGQKLTLDQAKVLMLSAYNVNVFIHNIESLNIMYGDLAQYNMLKEEFHKRNAAIASTGRMMRTDSQAIDHVNEVLGRPFTEKAGYKVKTFDGTIDSIIFQNNIKKSVMVDDPVSILNSEYGKALRIHFEKRFTKGTDAENAKKVEDAVNRVLEPYLNMDEGDAQGWISFDTYRILSKLEGRWSYQQEALFRQILTNPESITVQQIAEYFPARKYQYFGPTAAEGVSVTAFHKFSLFPLIPTVVKSKNLEVLHDNMMKQGGDYALFQSGSKVSTIVNPLTKKADVLYSDPELRTVDTNTEYTKNTLFVHYLKDQLDVNSHFKSKVIFSTQLRKLVEEGLVEGGVPVDFMEDETDLDIKIKAWDKLSEQKKLSTSPFYSLYKTYENKIDKLVEFRKAELRKEIGWNAEDLASGKGDLKKLIQFIQKELTRQDLADHEVDFIKVDEQGQLVYDLSVSLSAAKIERSLNAIVNQRLVRQKVNGESLVQLSSALLEATNPTEEERSRWGTNDLKTYRQDENSGKTLAMDVKVSLQGNFKQLINLVHKDGKKIAVYTEKTISVNATKKTIKEINQAATLARLNETIQDSEWRADKNNLDLISMVGVRIPVQGLNSMEFMAVWEFLPEEAGNVIIPPSEIVAKSGSDFDIDKLTIMMPNIIMINGKPEVIREVENGKSHEDNLELTTEINQNLKELRKEKREIINSYDKEGSDDLRRQVKENTEKVNKAQERMTQLLSYPSMSLTQRTELDNLWKVLDKLQDVADTIEDQRDILKAATEADKTKIKNINSKIAELTRLKEGVNSKAIENTTMFKIREILELSHNFVSLITPNDTSLVMPLAKQMASKREYKATDRLHGSSKTVSPTRVLEPAYNIYKHGSNAVGKETLGLGAVDNTFNTVFNRIGAYLNPTYKTAMGPGRRIAILMDHNTLEINKGEYKGQRGVSLSHLYDVNGENKIADVINQLMNGWVDVAKDAWIFDIQGNKQVTPVLMFLLQSGVPLDSVIHFISNPLVKEYVKEQKIATSAFAKALKQNAVEFNFYRSKARFELLKKLKMDNLLDFTFQKLKPGNVYKETINRTEGKNFTEIAKVISDYSFEQASNNEDAQAAFLHFLEIEDISQSVSNLKMKLNYDTSKSTTLFDAQKREADLKEILNDGKAPQEVITAILEESPIGSFRVAPFQIELWSHLFKFRNHPVINNFLIEKLSDVTANKKMKRIFGSTEKYVEEFKNDFISFMFADAVKSFNINDGSYKDMVINKTAPVKEVEHLDRGVVVAPNESGELVVYLDKTILDLQYNNQYYDPKAILNEEATLVAKELQKKYNYASLGLAPVPTAAFIGSRDSYYKFAIEREYLRVVNPFTEVSKSPYFKYKLEKNFSSLRETGIETTDQFEKRILKLTYEEILRDQALNNSLNNWKLFNSETSFADEFFELKEMYPTLIEDYNLMNDLIISEGSKRERGEKTKRSESFTNLALRDTRVTKDIIGIYHKNIVELSDPSVYSIPNEGMEPEVYEKENQRISEFFKLMPLVAFLQSGLNASDSLSMVRIMPTENIAEAITSVADKFDKKLKESHLIDEYFSAFNSQNDPSNISIRKRLKRYSPLSKTQETPNYSLTTGQVEVQHTLPMNFDDQTFDKILSGEITGTSRLRESIEDVQIGNIIELVRTNKKEGITRSMYVRATSNTYPLGYELAEDWSKIEGQPKEMYAELVDKGYAQFTFEPVDIDELEVSENEEFITVNTTNKLELESLIKNNPNVIFVLEGASDPESEGFFAGTTKVSNFDNVLPIVLRKDLSGKVSSAFNRSTSAQNIELIKESLDRIEEMYTNNPELKLVFLSPQIGYGSYLTGKVNEDSNEMRDVNSFNYLSSELYKRFGYKNRHNKIVDDVTELIKETQEVPYQLIVSDEELIEAQQRLTCNL